MLLSISYDNYPGTCVPLKSVSGLPHSGSNQRHEQAPQEHGIDTAPAEKREGIIANLWDHCALGR